MLGAAVPNRRQTCACFDRFPLLSLCLTLVLAVALCSRPVSCQDTPKDKADLKKTSAQTSSTNAASKPSGAAKPTATKPPARPEAVKPAAKPPAAKLTATQDLPPVLHDFTSLLPPPSKGAQPKAATAAELKNVGAFVSSDKNSSYIATVKELHFDYAIVTNPVPIGETAVSVLIGTRDGGKSSIFVELPSQVKKDVVLVGDFGLIAKAAAALDCVAPGICSAVLLAGDNETVVGQVIGLEVSSTKISVTYTAPVNANPAFLRIQNAAVHFPLISLAPPKEPLAEMRQIIAGDFCQEGVNTDCTTGFMKPTHASRPDHPEDLHSAAQPIDLVTDSYVTGTGSSVQYHAEVIDLGKETANISFVAPSSFQPVYLVLASADESYRFPYTPAPPISTTDINYESDQLSTVCNQVPDPSDASKLIPDCDNTPSSQFSLKSFTTGKEIVFVAMRGSLIVARVTAFADQQPNAIIVLNKQTKKSTIARRTTNPGGNNDMLNVHMSIMDQTTAMRNYGNRIAKRYLAITLDVDNPTSTKVQFNKSALYFDVDYVESREQGPTWKGFSEGIKEVSTLGLYQPSVYSPPFVAGAKNDGKPPREARFGLEQNVRQSPENYLSVLGSFDYTTTKTDDMLKVFELVGSVLTNIATGGVVADRSGAFRAGTSVFSSTFLPGVRGVVLDTSFINRLRSNLVSQTLQDTIQIPAKGSATTIVLLPRSGILSFTDAQVPVMIKRVLDVHLVPEVVSPVTPTGTKKDQCTTGNTRDQVRQSLGEPTGSTTNPDGSGTFSYAMGPVATVTFKADGTVETCSTPRTATEQMDLVKTLVEAKQTLTNLGLTDSEIQLVDGSTVIVDIPGISKTYHFDDKGNITTAYTFLFKAITTEAAKANETQASLEAFLEERALTPATKSAITALAKSATGLKAGQSATYPSPDVLNGTVIVTYKNNGAAKPIVIVDKVTFQGPQPKNIS